MENKSKELEVAIEAALAAGKILEKYFETEILKEYKEDLSVVTRADTDSEEIIREIITRNFPDHAMLGEEGGLTGESEYRWHIDPVDATKNFANGLPIFAVSIALEYKGEVIVGVIHNPALRTLFYAQKDKGAYLNDKKIYVSKDDEKTAIVTVAHSQENKELGRNLYFSLPDKVRSIRNLGCTAMELAYIACGTFEARYQLGFSTYDFAAGSLLVKEAGGKITTLDGGEWKFPENRFIASNGVFHDTLVQEVQKQIKKLK
jgi:myo-inositol-1(or 4)-monophosphatase